MSVLLIIIGCDASRVLSDVETDVPLPSIQTIDTTAEVLGKCKGCATTRRVVFDPVNTQTSVLRNEKELKPAEIYAIKFTTSQLAQGWIDVRAAELVGKVMYLIDPAK